MYRSDSLTYLSLKLAELTLEDLERARGFEPPTPTLARLCSTPELHPHRPRRVGPAAPLILAREAGFARLGLATPTWCWAISGLVILGDGPPASRLPWQLAPAQPSPRNAVRKFDRTVRESAA